MKENVGSTDRVVRSVLGPAMVLLGYARLGGDAGKPLGLLTMLAGIGIIESAITRVCPLNEALRIDSRSTEELMQDISRDLEGPIRDLETYQAQIIAVQETEQSQIYRG